MQGILQLLLLKKRIKFKKNRNFLETVRHKTLSHLTVTAPLEGSLSYLRNNATSPYKGAKFEAKEFLPTRSVAFDADKSSEGRARRLFEQLVLC